MLTSSDSFSPTRTTTTPADSLAEEAIWRSKTGRTSPEPEPPVGGFDLG